MVLELVYEEEEEEEEEEQEEEDEDEEGKKEDHWNVKGGNIVYILSWFYTNILQRCSSLICLQGMLARESFTFKILQFDLCP